MWIFSGPHRKGYFIEVTTLNLYMRARLGNLFTSRAVAVSDFAQRTIISAHAMVSAHAVVSARAIVSWWEDLHVRSAWLDTHHPLWHSQISRRDLVRNSGECGSWIIYIYSASSLARVSGCFIIAEAHTSLCMRARLGCSTRVGTVWLRAKTN